MEETFHWLGHFIALGTIGNLLLALSKRRAGHREQVMPIKRELDDVKARLRQIRELTDAEMRP